jgi:NADH-quinone oxidoreductase subunit E
VILFTCLSGTARHEKSIQVVVFVTVQTTDVEGKVKAIIEPWKGKKGGLIPILQGVQHEFGFLQEDAMEIISRELRIPTAEVYGVATFYAQFHLKPRGRHIIRICRGTACHVRGSLKILERVKEILKIEENGTTEDLRFTLEPVACLGACGLAPVVMINDVTYGRLTPDGIKPILDKHE